jgi:hypothetical protein
MNPLMRASTPADAPPTDAPTSKRERERERSNPCGTTDNLVKPRIKDNSDIQHIKHSA